MVKNKNFEKSLTRLQEISKEIENEEISLEKSIKLYKEGLELASYCSEFLSNAEQEVFVLQQEFEDKFELTPFENLSEF